LTEVVVFAILEFEGDGKMKISEVKKILFSMGPNEGSKGRYRRTTRGASAQAQSESR